MPQEAKIQKNQFHECLSDIGDRSNLGAGSKNDDGIARFR